MGETRHSFSLITRDFDLEPGVPVHPPCLRKLFARATFRPSATLGLRAASAMTRTPLSRLSISSMTPPRMPLSLAISCQMTRILRQTLSLLRHLRDFLLH